MININLEKVNTPCYIIDESKIIKNLEILDSVQKRTGCKIIVSVCAIVSTTNSTGKCAEVFFRVDINHSAASGSSARIIAVSNAPPFSVLSFSILHLGADELESR